MWTFSAWKDRTKKPKTPVQSKDLSFKVSTIIIDRMDQSKTQIPHFEHDSEFTSSMWRLCVHLVSVALYYIGILYMAFLSYLNTAYSINLTLSVPMTLFYMLNESLTDVLYLQKDNCPIKKQNQVFIINTIRIIS